MTYGAADLYRKIKTKSEYVEYYQKSRRADAYAKQDFYGANPLLTRVETEVVLSVAKSFIDLKKCKLLDLATGPGRIVGSLEGFCGFSIGVDTSLAMLSYAKKRLKKSLLVAGDVSLMPFRDKQFDLVTGFKFMINMPEDDRLAILKDIRRVLKKEGVLAINFHLNAVGIRGFRDRVFGFRAKNKLLSSFQARREVESVGFKFIGIYGVNMIIIYRLFSFFPAKFLVRLDSFVGRIFPLNYFSDTFIVLASKG